MDENMEKSQDLSQFTAILYFAFFIFCEVAIISVSYNKMGDDIPFLQQVRIIGPAILVITIVAVLALFFGIYKKKKQLNGILAKLAAEDEKDVFTMRFYDVQASGRLSLAFSIRNMAGANYRVIVPKLDSIRVIEITDSGEMDKLYAKGQITEIIGSRYISIRLRDPGQGKNTIPFGNMGIKANYDLDIEIPGTMDRFGDFKNLVSRYYPEKIRK
ncbi:MAG: hypothetical protein WC506_01205 [Candidatus Micrarchaeia archaeon]